MNTHDRECMDRILVLLKGLERKIDNMNDRLGAMLDRNARFASKSYEDELRPTGGGFARRLSNGDLITSRENLVQQPIYGSAPGLAGWFGEQTIVGYGEPRMQRIVRHFDSAGNPTGCDIYTQMYPD